MRRLPVYLLLDTSGSMAGEPIEAVKNGVQMMLHSLRQKQLLNRKETGNQWFSL